MNMIEKRKAAAGQSGFTLIELLVVIAILAVLGGAAIIGIGALRENASQQVCLTEVETIETAAEAWDVAPGHTAGSATMANLTAGGADALLKKITPGDWALAYNSGTYVATNNGAHADLEPDCTPTP